MNTLLGPFSELWMRLVQIQDPGVPALLVSREIHFWHKHWQVNGVPSKKLPQVASGTVSSHCFSSHTTSVLK